jgi:4-amino-4-deoxy-L-arabinose transferase-like glycosyltransferase
MFAVAGVLGGEWDALLTRQKGPGEVLLAAGPLALTGRIDEWTTRLPFALCGLGILLGAFVLARALLGRRLGVPVGLAAALILAVDGFLIGFSRIVQYQSLLTLMGLGALWCCWRFYEGAVGRQRVAGGTQNYLTLAAVFTAVGLLAHYDTVFVVPALAYLTLAGGRRRGWRAGQWLWGLGMPLLVGAVLLCSFYLPFVSHDYFSQRTLAYLQWRQGGEQQAAALFNNLRGYFPLATFYNTTFQIVALGAALGIGLLGWLARYVRPPALGLALGALLLVGLVLTVWAPGLLVLPSGASWAIVAFGLPLAALALAPATPAALRVLLLAFACPFVVESFLLAVPNTHFYTMDVPAALLAALAGIMLAGRARALRLPLALAALLVLLLAVPYMQLAFVQQMPEYERLFPAARPALYRSTYGDVWPNGSRFGFPHRDGWKVIGELYRRGELQGDYDSNQKPQITGWYIRDAARCGGRPTYYFVAWSEDEIRLPEGYVLFGSVMVDGRQALDIYSREPLREPPQLFALEDYRAAFDAQPPPRFEERRCGA